MAPVQGHLMVPEAVRLIKFAVSQAKALIRTKAPTSTQLAVVLNPIRNFTQKSTAVPRSSLLKESKPSYLRKDGSRVYSSASNPSGRNPLGPKYDRSTFPSSRTSRAISRKGVAPFASTLRPNLTGGTLSRSAGGYSLGGAGRARQFSHTSGCQAQVVQNVSAGIRAFFVSGSKARYDGVDPVNGEKRWRTVTKAQDTVAQKWEAATAQGVSPIKGTSLEFQLSPTITALLASSPSISGIPVSVADSIEEKPATLNSPGLLHTLSADFARAFRDLALITHDLSKLSAFGDLPVSLSHSVQGPILRVRFPGCDANTVSALCDEAGIRRGSVVEDPVWSESRDVEMALLFPFAPSDPLDTERDEEDVSRFFGARAQFQQQQQQRPRNLWLQSGEKSMNKSFTATSLSDASSSSLDHDLSTLHYEDVGTPSLAEERNDGSLSDIYMEDETRSSLPAASSPNHHHYSPPSPRYRQAAARHSVSTTNQEEDFEGVEGIYRFLTAIEDARRC